MGFNVMLLKSFRELKQESAPKTELKVPAFLNNLRIRKIYSLSPMVVLTSTESKSSPYYKMAADIS